MAAEWREINSDAEPSLVVQTNVKDSLMCIEFSRCDLQMLVFVYFTENCFPYSSDPVTYYPTLHLSDLYFSFFQF
jgi:hypothetical protein